jgi:S-formylglutathione hydrolase FrmB
MRKTKTRVSFLPVTCRLSQLVTAFTLAICQLSLVTGYAAGRAESRTIQSRILGRAVRYTVLLPPSYDTQKTRRYPILYYLHGLGDNDQTLLQGGWDLVEQLQDSGQIREFLIATPDGGRSFYINSRDGRQHYEDFFVREFIPAIEQRYRATGTRAGRGISGTSMGGYGALRFAFRYPELFVSVSAHMAALAEELPGGLRSSFGPGLSAFGQPFDAQFWNRNTPFALIRESRGLNGLAIYFDCGRQDDYGFDAGAQALHQLLQQRGIPHEFHLYPGRHDGEFVAEHFPESLRFDSRAFAGQK